MKAIGIMKSKNMHYILLKYTSVIVNDRKQGLCKKKKSRDMNGNNKMLETSNYIARKQIL